ncbi:hypothetical protein HHL17_22630 [Chitinophaga sp. G-6-1-13]|uniref:Uncharacterized protein n=1 Tax=Chitinophaga fulva TaxID=2728842 RepID=A0A848GN25_9BACT|nr:hypothetical protein [Chitinophaga fulva]NML40015.1 hypothetical protein [Chitinophaga fulva]
MKQVMVVAVLMGWIALMAVVPADREKSAAVAHTLKYFREQARLFAESAADLSASIEKLDRNSPATINAAKEALKRCRAQYKSIEFFLDYFLSSTSIVYNSPPVHEVEEPFMEYREPTGLQVIEALLFEEDAAARQRELLQQAMLVHTSAADLPSLLYGLEIDDRQVLESIRLELVRMSALGIAGYDAPELQTGIPEAGRSLMAVKMVLQPYLSGPCPEADNINLYLDKALKLTGEDSDFVSFNRLRFLTDAVLPLQHHLDVFIQRKGWALNENASDIFNPVALNLGFGQDTSSPEIQLGRALFLTPVKLFLCKLRE